MGASTLAAVPPCASPSATPHSVYHLSQRRGGGLHVASVVSTVYSNVGAVAALLSAFGMNPLSTPPSFRMHGVSNVLCVTVWFFMSMTNFTTSPMAAVTSVGS